MQKRHFDLFLFNVRLFLECPFFGIALSKYTMFNNKIYLLLVEENLRKWSSSLSQHDFYCTFKIKLINSQKSTGLIFLIINSTKLKIFFKMTLPNSLSFTNNNASFPSPSILFFFFASNIAYNCLLSLKSIINCIFFFLSILQP